MPTGSFWGDQAVDRGSFGGGITGTGAASQPKFSPAPGSPEYNNWDYVTANDPARRAAATAGGSGYSTGKGQYASPIGPSQYMPGPITQYPDSIYAPSPGQQIATALYGPQQTILDQQLSRQQSMLGTIGMDADYKSDALRRDTGLSKQLLGLDEEQLGIDSGLTKTQLANLDKLRGILKKQYGLAGETLANQLGGYQVQEDKARDMAKRETFDLRSALTARGAFNTVANDRGTGRINRDLTYNLRDINLGRGAADISYRGNVLGLDEKGIGYDNQAASLSARLANNGLDLERLGIKGQQLDNALQDGLHQIGLDSMVSINGLLDAIGSTNSQQSQLAATILTETMKYANLPPEVLAAVQGALGIGGTAAPAAPGASSPGTPNPMNKG